MSNQVLFFFSCLGVFNGLLLSIYFFFFRAKKQLSGYLLGALLLALSIRIGKSVAYFFDYSLSKTYLQLGLTACFFIGPLLYFFVSAETRPVRKLPRPWLMQLALWTLVITTTGVLYPYTRFPQLWGQYFIPFIYLQWSIYVAFSLLLLIPVLKNMARKLPVKPHEIAVLVIGLVVTVLLISYVWAYLDITKGSYINSALWFSLAIYAVAFALLYRNKTADLFSTAARKYAGRKTDPADSEGIADRVKKAMAEKELFKNPSLKLSDLAREIKVPAHQLSQVLNENLQKNFTLFVNEYRINEACRILSQQTHLTIEAVGEEVGFQSKSTFFASFKKIKGTTPSVYQQSVGADL